MTTYPKLLIQERKDLLDLIGEVGAERFIALVLSELFDYTLWQLILWMDKAVDEISGNLVWHREK